MTPSNADRLEHLMRILPTQDAELIYLEAQATSWLQAIGTHLDQLPQLDDGTPLSNSVTGRTCRKGWRNIVPAKPGSAWEELSFLRLTTRTTSTAEDPFDELDSLKFESSAHGLAYRN